MSQAAAQAPTGFLAGLIAKQQADKHNQRQVAESKARQALAEELAKARDEEAKAPRLAAAQAVPAVVANTATTSASTKAGLAARGGNQQYQHASPAPRDWMKRQWREWKPACGWFLFVRYDDYLKYYNASSNHPNSKEDKNPRKRKRADDEEDEEEEDENKPSRLPTIAHHVIERMEQRGIDLSKALWTARHGKEVPGSIRFNKQRGTHSVKKLRIGDWERPLEAVVDRETGDVITVMELSPPPKRALEMQEGLKEMETRIGFSIRQTAIELPFILRFDSYNELRLLTIEDIQLIQSIAPTKEEIIDYFSANNGFKPEDSPGNAVTDWIEAVSAAKDSGVDFDGLLDRIIKAKQRDINKNEKNLKKKKKKKKENRNTSPRRG